MDAVPTTGSCGSCRFVPLGTPIPRAAAADPLLLLGQSRPRVYAFIRSRGFSGEDADDLTQETLMRAYQHLSGFRGSSFVTWLCSIARNLTIDHLRRQRLSLVPLDELDGDLLGTDDPQLAVLEEVQIEAVWRAVADLTAPHQRLLRLRFSEGKPFAEIAVELGCTPVAAKLRVFRAVEALRKRCGRRGREGA